MIELGEKNRLFCYSQRLLRLARQLDENEIGLRIEIIFTGFVNHSEITFFCPLFIRDDLIDLAFFQILAILVVHAKRKPIILFCFHHNPNPKSS